MFQIPDYSVVKVYMVLHEIWSIDDKDMIILDKDTIQSGNGCVWISFFFLFVLVSICHQASAVYAAAPLISNPSFESSALADGTVGPWTGWNVYPYYLYVFNPPISSTPSYATEGNNYACLDQSPYGYGWQTIGVIEPNTVYKLTVDVATMYGENRIQDSWMYLAMRAADNGSVLGSETGMAVLIWGKGSLWGDYGAIPISWTTKTIYWDSSGSSLVGKYLQISITGLFIAVDRFSLTQSVGVSVPVENPGFEIPSVVEGQCDVNVDGWNKYIWPGGWQGPVVKDPILTDLPASTVDGENLVFVDAGGVYQDLEEVIEPETTYILSANLVKIAGSSNYYDIRLRCGERNADLATVSNAEVPFPAFNQWFTVWCKWDSGNSEYVGRKLQIWCKGTYFGLDNFKIMAIRTRPQCVYAPSPMYGSITKSYNPILTWIAGEGGGGATEYDVFFGTDFIAVQNAERTSPEYKGRRTSCQYSPGVLPSCYMVYYWRVDQVCGEQVFKGNVWTFSTAAPIIYDIDRSTWTAADALGRRLPMYQECGPIRPNRYVGLFYWNPGGSGFDADMDGIAEYGPQNASETIAAHLVDPSIRFNYANYYWAEPEMGYYVYWDEYVIRKQVQMFNDADIDVLVIEANTTLFAETVCNVFEKIRAEGERTPQIMFFAIEDAAAKSQMIYNKIYAENRYSDLWFYWQGKPLLLSMSAPETLSSVVQDFFTVRECWAWTSDNVSNTWSWIDYYPQQYAVMNGQIESISVAAGYWPTINRGRSYSNGSQPAYDQYYLTPYTSQGRSFSEQWNRALSIDPEFVFVTDWNWWVNGCYQGNGIQKFLGHMTFPNDPDWYYYFVDGYNQEYSRDIEPMKGGHTDNYYYQLVDYIRQYKGVLPPVTVSRPKTIQIDGDFTDWVEVSPEYEDDNFDTTHRYQAGYSNNVFYVNTTGRNDFINLKVTYDEEYVYFYAETYAAISPYTDSNWMILFIDADRKYSTGWNGYDYAINLGGVNALTTSLKHTSGGWNWVIINADIHYAVSDNKLELKILRSQVAQDAKSVTFDFHWADNIQKSNDITEFFISGDSAPNRRFNYRFDASIADRACLQLQDNSLGKAGDINDDCIIDIHDLCLLAQSWLNVYTLELFYEMSNDWMLDYMPDRYTEVQLLQEDFEVGSFDKYSYVHSGDMGWGVVAEDSYQGQYCAKSGSIGHNQRSILEITYYNDIATAISFYQKISSQNNGDYLGFYIDDVLKGSWSGTFDWIYRTYSVMPGRHTFKWIYSKNGSISSGSDCAWIDLVRQD